VIELLFGALGIIPTNHNVARITEGAHWNYTAWLNIAFLIIALILVVRFLRTGGPAMLTMMDMPAGEMGGDHTGHATPAQGESGMSHGTH